LKTAEELRANGVKGSGRPTVNTLYEVPKDQYKQTPLPEKVPEESGYTLWHKHESVDRVWAIRFMASLPDSLDWQFAGVTSGKRKGESGVTVPTVTARYVYVTLQFKLAVTWLVSPTDEAVGLRFILASCETGARWCQPSEITDVVTTLLDAEYAAVDPKSSRRSWLR
jgi:hypothetical protein